jgi:O-antigen/teichoic acid export membrane protein
MRADFYFVEKYCDAIALGNYVQISKIGQMALIFPNLLGGVIFPYTVNALDTFADKISFFCRLLTLAFVFLAIGFLVTGKYIFVWLLGADFNLMYAGIAGTFVGIYCLAMSMILISYLEGKNKQNIVLLANFIILALIIIGDFIYVPLYGYLAAAIIFSIANLVGFIVLLSYFIKSTGVRIKNIFFFTKHDTAIFKF